MFLHILKVLGHEERTILQCAQSVEDICPLTRRVECVHTCPGKREVNNGAFFMIDLPIIRSFWEGETIHYDQDHVTKQFGELISKFL